MTEYEWEVGRIPRAPDGRGLGGFRSRKGPIAEYAALEFPRESVAWVLKAEPNREPRRPAFEKR
jgi:hypothetical protein